MKSTQLKIIGIAIVSILIASTLYYFTNMQNPVGADVDYPTYEVLNFGSYDDLNSYLQNSSGSNTYALDGGTEESLQRSESTGGISNDEKSPTAMNSDDYSSTNIQELGVDEADIVKTDGSYIYVISGTNVYIISAYPAEDARIISTITLNESQTPQNLFINGDRLAIISQSYLYRTVVYSDILEDTDIDDGEYSDDEGDEPVVPEAKSEGGSREQVGYDIWQDTTTVHIFIFDLSEITSPEQVQDVQMEGYYSTSRMINDYVYVITTSYAYEPVLYATDESSYIPSIKVNSAIEPVKLSDIYYVDSPETSNTMTHIVSINIQDETADVETEVLLLGNPSTYYVSTNAIYIACNNYNYDYTLLSDIIDEYILPLLPTEAENELDIVDSLSLDDYQKSTVIEWIIQNYIEDLDEQQKQDLASELVVQFEKTNIHKINIENGTITYEYQGTVPGYVKNQFSMSEYDGYLRIATTVNGWTMSPYISSVESFNNIYVLDDTLDIIGELEHIADGETIYSTRFVDTVCYLVTYQQIDPFFVIDLQNPEHPEILGELKIPGYSSYLHPYDKDHVIGIGMENSTIKISLFDVNDVSNPIELATYHIEGSTDEYYWTYSTALYEHKAFLFDKEKNLLIIPVSTNSIESAYVFNITTDHIELQGIISHESYYNESMTTNPKDDYYWKGDYRYSIKRSLFIQDVIYTISDALIQMNQMNTLDKINSIDLI